MIGEADFALDVDYGRRIEKAPALKAE